MQNQTETRYQYQNVIEHRYLFRFESIPLDSGLLDKDHIYLALLLDNLFSLTKTYSENSPDVFSLIDLPYDRALTTTDKSTTTVLFLRVVVQVQLQESA